VQKENNLIPRFGTFFILVGLVFLCLFVFSSMGHDTNVIYLFLSIVSFLAGFSLRRKKPVNESGRFGMVRRATGHGRHPREDGNNEHEK
jgi:hypothetical protein